MLYLHEGDETMKTVAEVSKLTGVSIRTLHHYDSIGLLEPSCQTESGYRLYDDCALERLQHILLFRELQFPLKEIKNMLASPAFDRNKALEQQIALLQLKKEHIENLIVLARGISMIGVKKLDFNAFDTKKLDDYVRQAKETWGTTDAYKEFEEKSKDWTEKDTMQINTDFMNLFTEFGNITDLPPSDEAVQSQVEHLRAYITEHFYDCTPEILKGLGDMYSGGGSMTENINKMGGPGTAEFASQAIDFYCKNQK